MHSPKLLYKPIALLLLLGLLIASGHVVAESGPNLRRACLTNDGKDATLYWVPSTDACFSFRSYHIYGRPNAASSFVLLDSVNLQSQKTYTQPNIGVTTWEYFIITHSPCGSSDSIVSSDTVGIDLISPSVSSLDSVSVDISTGNLQLGWSGNPSPDIAGYFIFRTIGSQNMLWGSSPLTYQVITATVPQDTVYSFIIAAFDSCGIAANGVQAHSSIKLAVDLDKCAGEAVLTWTPYIGWGGVKGFDVVVDKNNQGYSILSSVDGNTLTYTMTGIKPGDNIRCFVRAWSLDNPAISSSSNRQDIAIPLVNLPKINYLASVSVSSNSFVKLHWISDLNGEISTFRIMRGVDSNQMDEIKSIAYDPLIKDYTYDDKDAKLQVGAFIYYYRILVYDLCENFSGSISNLANTIKDSVIQISDNSNMLVWNPYSFWDRGVGYYYIYRGVELNGAYTWDIAGSAKATDTAWFDIAPPGEAGNTGVCYHVVAYENPGNVLTSATETSTSNFTCEIKDFTFFSPNAFNPFGINRKWLPKASYVNYEKSVINIYTRWGQHVKTITDIHDGWDGKDKNGNWMSPGMYIYTATITGVNKRKQTFEGYFVFLR